MFANTPISLIEDHEIVEMNVIVYNTTDGRQCISPGVDTRAAYVVGNECSPYDRRFVDIFFFLLAVGSVLNGVLSKRRIVEEMIDEETGELRSVLSSKYIYEVRDYSLPEYIELYIGSYRII
jgi:hypothetical protein